MTRQRKAHDLRTLMGRHAVPGRNGIPALCGRIVGHLGDEYRADNVTRREIVTCKTCLKIRAEWPWEPDRGIVTGGQPR